MKPLLLLPLLLLPLTGRSQQPADSVARTEAIDSVVVTARKPLLVYKQTGNVAVDVEHLKFAPLFLGEKDIFKFLQLLPGITSGKDGMSGLVVRGGSNDQTLILYDDVPIYNQTHAFGLLSIFSGETVQSAEVFKGYIPPAYGSRLSALTQIRTRDGDRRQHGQSLTVGTLSLAGTAHGPLVRDKGSYLVSARYFFPEAFLAAIGNDIRFGFYDVTGKLAYDIRPGHTLSLGLYSGDDHISNSDTGASNRLGYGNTTASLRLASDWNDRLRSTMVVYYTYLQNRLTADYRDKEDRSHGKTTFTTHEAGARLAFEQRVAGCWTLDYGANVSWQKFLPMHTVAKVNGVQTRRSYPSQELLTGAIHLNNRLQWGAWRADIGVRGALYNTGGRTAWAVEPRGQIACDFGRDNSVWLSATMNSQPLVQFNRYYYSMPIDFWTPFQDNRLQRAWQFSAGGRARPARNLTLSAEAYVKRMRNLPMIYDSDDFLLGDGGFVYGTGRVAGAEAMLQWQTERLSLTASYTYTHALRRSERVSYPFEYDIPHQLTLFASCHVLDRPGRRHTLSLNVAWHTGLPFRLTDEVYPDTEGDPIAGITTYPTMRMRNYFRTDISYNMERRKRNGVRNWQFSIINATWHNNPVSIYPHCGRYKASVLVPIMPSVSYTRTFGK